MKITIEDVKKLRKQTGRSLMDCKEALIAADGNFEKAITILEKRIGLAHTLT